MAWIAEIDEREAEGSLKDQYSKLKEPWGGIDNILKIHSLNPESLAAHVQLYKTVMFGKSPIPRIDREMIALVVSSINQCHYWITHHGEGLLKLKVDKSLIHQLISDYKIANITPAQMAMLDYASKLTIYPKDMIKEDVERLREIG